MALLVTWLGAKHHTRCDCVCRYRHRNGLDAERHLALATAVTNLSFVWPVRSAVRRQGRCGTGNIGIMPLWHLTDSLVIPC